MKNPPELSWRSGISFRHCKASQTHWNLLTITFDLSNWFHPASCGGHSCPPPQQQIATCGLNGALDGRSSVLLPACSLSHMDSVHQKLWIAFLLLHCLALTGSVGILDPAIQKQLDSHQLSQFVHQVRFWTEGRVCQRVHKIVDTVPHY